MRTKFRCLLTELEKEFLKKDSLEVMSSEWGLIWEALIQMHSSATFKKLSEEDKKEGKEPVKSDKNKKFELKRNLSCSYCKKKGHTLENCYLKEDSQELIFNPCLQT